MLSVTVCIGITNSTIMTSLLRLRKENRMFLVLILFTCFDILLILTRLYIIQPDLLYMDSLAELKGSRGVTGTFFFLVWNLVLAWVPFLIAWSLERTYIRTGSMLLVAAGLFIWLLFFPNAPYIITDLLHLKDRPFIPHWYDVMLFTSFAWTGLLLGFASLYIVQQFIRKHISGSMSWVVAFGAIFLGSFGVYLGRFQRWNSWDLFTQPIALLRDIGHSFIDPTAFVNTWGITLVLAGFMSIGYLTFVVWGGEREEV
jgi:uncharacterized membrane protein